VVKLKDKLISKYRSKIREKAISRTKKRLAVSGKSASSLTKDELEIIVREEEDSIILEIRTGSLFAVLLVLGIT
jgi:hypothetical protein